jgi:hypothetical protein
VPVAHVCNPSYSGGRDQEDHGSKPAWAYSSARPISKTLHKNRAGGMAQGEGPSSSPSTTHTKKETYIDTALSPKAHSLY